MAMEGSGNTGKKPKTEGAGNEVAVCTCGHEAAAGGKTDGPYCKIHHTAGHDLQECWQVKHLAKKQKLEYEKHDKEKGYGGAGGSRKKNHGARRGRYGKADKQKEKPARGRYKKEGEDEEDDGDDDEEASEQEF
jgi:hypothetical protein